MSVLGTFQLLGEAQGFSHLISLFPEEGACQHHAWDGSTQNKVKSSMETGNACKASLMLYLIHEHKILSLSHPTLGLCFIGSYSYLDLFYLELIFQLFIFHLNLDRQMVGSPLTHAPT